MAERLKLKGISVAAPDPGWVKLDMGTQAVERYPEEIAQEILNLLDNQSTGQFWHRNQVRAW